MAHFWSIFPIFGAKTTFLENLAVTHNFTCISILSVLEPINRFRRLDAPWSLQWTKTIVSAKFLVLVVNPTMRRKQLLNCVWSELVSFMFRNFAPIHYFAHKTSFNLNNELYITYSWVLIWTNHKKVFSENQQHVLYLNIWMLNGTKVNIQPTLYDKILQNWLVMVVLFPLQLNNHFFFQFCNWSSIVIFANSVNFTKPDVKKWKCHNLLLNEILIFPANINNSSTNC